jgi:hypothetical protein
MGQNHSSFDYQLLTGRYMPMYVRLSVNQIQFIWFRFTNEDELNRIINNDWEEIVDTIERVLHIHVDDPRDQIVTSYITYEQPLQTTIYLVPQEEFDSS